MKTQSFFTSAIQFTNPQCMEDFYNFYSKFYVHPTNFRNEDGSFVQDELNEDPMDGNYILGKPIDIIVNEDQLTLIMSGDGGLDFCRVDRVGGDYYQTSAVLGNFLETIFNYEFAEKNPNVEIYIENLDTVTREKTIETIRMSDYHSKQAYEARYHEASQEHNRIKRQISELQQKQQRIEAQIEVYKLLSDDSDGLPF